MRIALGKLEDLFEERGDRAARPHVMFDTPHAVAKAALDVSFERAFLDRAFVAEALYWLAAVRPIVAARSRTAGAS
ncbi:hypothetical protein AWB75_07001 [Caballeronia catudaia]|uniref:Uncharacterized protein n=1 Tax=Caballeronia catudaia TaxID=1777136 RepID=A0A158DNV1_9BURK|nr:hypothetical protein [Caballeronia catudaia]SAK96282.1 hypothetical protein AWB75_07001 [Caballeronia catudaia]